MTKRSAFPIPPRTSLKRPSLFWIVNRYQDDFVKALTFLKSPPLALTTELNVSGFIATVELPRHLRLPAQTNERPWIFS